MTTASREHTGTSEARPDPLDATAVRRHLHRRPEIGFLEIETADLAWSVLSDLGWQLRGGRDLVDVHDHPGMPSRDELDAAAQRVPTGLAMPMPAMSGADPCTGSNIDG